MRRHSHVNVTLPAGEEDAARRFYGGLLGLPEVRKPEPNRSRGGVWFDAGGLDIHLSVRPADEGPPSAQAHFGLEVADVAALRRALERAGIACDEGGPVTWKRFFAADPFGNRIEFHERGGLRG